MSNGMFDYIFSLSYGFSAVKIWKALLPTSLDLGIPAKSFSNKYTVC
jgi:hypothetical protein